MKFLRLETPVFGVIPSNKHWNGVTIKSCFQGLVADESGCGYRSFKNDKDNCLRQITNDLLFQYRPADKCQGLSKYLHSSSI
jgi:hypothetical protein